MRFDDDNLYTQSLINDEYVILTKKLGYRFISAELQSLKDCEYALAWMTQLRLHPGEFEWRQRDEKFETYDIDRDSPFDYLPVIRHFVYTASEACLAHDCYSMLGQAVPKILIGKNGLVDLDGSDNDI